MYTRSSRVDYGFLLAVSPFTVSSSRRKAPFIANTRRSQSTIINYGQFYKSYCYIIIIDSSKSEPSATRGQAAGLPLLLVVQQLKGRKCLKTRGYYS